MAHAKNNKISEADSLYNSLIAQNPSRTLYSLSTLRTDLIKTDSVIVEYLKGEDEEKYEILVSLNSADYNYNTFPYLSSLARSSKIEYEYFLKTFSKILEIKDYISSYGVYMLSSDLCERMDFNRARKMAALSLRFSDANGFNFILQSNFARMDWLYKNSAAVLAKMKYF